MSSTPPPVSPEPARVRDAMGWVAVVAAAVASVALLVLWHRSYVSYDELIVPGLASGELRLASNDGAVVVGVFETGNRPRPVLWFRRGGPTEFGRLIGAGEDDPLPFAVSLGLSDIGVAVPHWAIAAPPALFCAWWFWVARRRGVVRHRAAHGLCLACGYDLRQSPERCPECGATPAAAAAAAAQMPDFPAALREAPSRNSAI